MEEVEFKSGNLTLRGNIFYPKQLKKQNPTILFVHGWTSEKKRSFQYAEALANLGYICFLFDMRGHGMSEGDISIFKIKEFLDDVIVAYDFLLNVKGVNQENISAIGSSFGGYLITLLSTKRKLKNLAMRVPADYQNDAFEKSKMQNSGSDNPAVVEWRKKLKQPHETFALQAINNFDGNILIIESEKDDVVPHETIQSYINAIQNKRKLTHIVMKDAPHSLKEGKFRDQVTKILIKWFKFTFDSHLNL